MNNAPTADALARIHTAEAIGTLRDVMSDAGAKPSERIAAAQAILDRGHGRAVQAVISVPARQAVAARLAAMSDDALLLIAKGTREGGGGSEKGDPTGPESATGTHTHNAFTPDPQVLRPGQMDKGVVDADFIDLNDI